MKTNVAPVATLRVTRLIQAPRERVFAAWTTPEDIVKWLGPENCQVLEAKVDLRVGGEYQIRVNARDCNSGETGEMEVHGVYREIKRPARLVYTWGWSGEPDLQLEETVVTVNFLDRNGFTEVQIIHERFPNTEVRDRHSHGWNGSLDKLEKQLAAEAGRGQPCAKPGTFCWNELVATGTGGAAKFYTGLFGWQTEAMPEGMEYTLFKQGGQPVGGLMAGPNKQAPPHWLAYVLVESVDASAKKAAELGATMLVPPRDIPTVGRIAVFQDPQGAALGIFEPEKKS